MTSSVRAHLAIGANLGDCASTIRSALVALDAVPGVTVRIVSPVYETEPIGAPGQPAYLNAAIEVGTTLSPRGLLEACLEIERRHGRTRPPDLRWGPRTLDIDVLLYGDEIIREPGLVIPHPRMHERPFVLEPLAAIASRLVHPVLGRTVESLRNVVREQVTAVPTAPVSAGRTRRNSTLHCMPHVRPLEALLLAAVLALGSSCSFAQAPVGNETAEPAAAPPSTRPAAPDADELPPPRVPASRTRPEDAADPIARAGEQLVRDMVAAYRALPTLTDHVVLDFRIGIDLPPQEYRLRIDHGTDAWLETEVQEFTALGDTFYVLHRGVRDRYLKVPLVNNISETMGTHRSQFIPHFSLRYDQPMKQILRSFLFLVPGEARISSFRKRVEGEDGRRKHALTVLGRNGQSTVYVDAETKLITSADTEHTPPNAPPGFKVKCHVSFDPQVRETLAEPIAFDPGRRTLVSTLGELLDVAPAELKIRSGDPVPEFDFFTLEGEQIALTDLRGKVTVLLMWASNCVGCQTEIRQAKELRDWALESDLPVAVYPINLLEPARSQGEKWESATNVWDKERYRFPSLFDPDDFLATALGVEFEALPMTILIDRQGRLVTYRRELGERYAELMKAEVEKVLAATVQPGPSPDPPTAEGPPLPEGPPIPTADGP